jgi:hypothetical protein
LSAAVKRWRFTTDDRLKSNIRKVKPSQFPGQDLEALTRKIQADAMELDTAGQYDHNLTLTILDRFIEAGGAMITVK